MMHAETELRLIRARLAAVLLLVDGAGAALSRRAVADLRKIIEYARGIAGETKKKGVATCARLRSAKRQATNHERDLATIRVVYARNKEKSR